MRSFYNKYYVSENIRLVILTNYDCKILEEIIENTFGNIKNGLLNHS